MFDRFVVGGSSSPLGARGGAIAVSVHAAILAFGLHSTSHRAQSTAPVVAPPSIWVAAPVTPRPPVDGGISVPAPVRFTEPLPFPVLPPTTLPGPDRTIFEPGPVPHPGPGEFVGGDSLGVYEGALVEEPPELLSAPVPQYPELLRQARVEGVVLVEAVVDTLGRVERGSLRVVSSPHPGLSAAAEASIAGAVFRPGRMSGRAVRVLVRVPVQFTVARR